MTPSSEVIPEAVIAVNEVCHRVKIYLHSHKIK